MTIRRELIEALRAYAEVSDRVVDALGANHGLHRSDLRALSLVLRGNTGSNVTASQIARSLGLTSAATTALVDRLEKQGHVVRIRSSADRRKVALVATDVAHNTGREIFGPLAVKTVAALREFNEAELATALRVVEAATAALDGRDIAHRLPNPH